ncbi:MAG: hypothetical protein M3O34_16230 [Chloroflexota bacterium]|nr:hypothetical protein [Chloroflexota bacterium]
MDERKDILSVEEIDAVILALLEGQGGAGATDEEMDDAVRWARKARINGHLLDLILDEKVVMRLGDGGSFLFATRESASVTRGTTRSDDRPETRPS